MEPLFVVAKIIGSPGVVVWEWRSHTFLHYSNVTWRFRFFISICTCSRLRELKKVLLERAPEHYLALEFGLNLNQGCSGVGTAFPHLFL